MECPAADALTPGANQIAGPLQHFMRRFSGKREQQNVGWIDARIDEIGNPIDKSACLAAAGPSDHQRGPVTCSDRR